MAGQKIADAFIEISARLDKFKKQIDGAAMRVQNGFQKVNKKLSTAFSGLGGVIAGAFAVEKIAAFATEAIKLASVAEGVERAFNRLDDPNLLNNLKAATRGTVSELELMQSAVNAQNLGVPIKNLASLFAFATQRAADTGESVDYLVQSIVTGIGRKSPLILDNLGISAIDLKAQLNGVGLETASVGDIAEAVGKIASKSMADIGNAALTSSQKIAQIGAEFENLKVDVGNKLIPIMYTFLDLTNQTLDAWATLFNGDASFTDVFSSYFDLLIPGLRESKMLFDKLSSSSEEAATKLGEVDQSVKTLSASAAESARTFDFVSGTWSEAWAEFKVGADNAVVGMETLDEYFEKESGAKYFNGLTGQWENVAKKIETATKKAKEFNEAAFDIAGANNQDNSGRRDFGGGDIEAIPEFLEEGEEFENLDANMLKIQENAKGISDAFIGASNPISAFGDVLGNTLNSALEGSTTFFEDFGKQLLQLITRLLIAVAVAELLKKALPGAGIVSGASGLLGGGAGGGITQLFSILKGQDILLSSSRTGRNNNRTIGG